ncbi:MAG: hypothetical protein SVR81_07595, partial [Chloroflexota bacterium]|nr:hypothetical protein [Chloroflexota bacterium]
PLDTAIQVRGTQTDVGSDTLRWQLIQMLRQDTPTAGSMGGGGGGGGGGMGFSPDPDATPEPTPTPEPMPYDMGDPVEGLVGTLSVQRMVRNDGSKYILAYLSAPTPDEPESYRYYQLLGDGLEDLESLNRFHARVWGTYTQDDHGQPAIQLARFEKAYPEEIIQAWLGVQTVVELDGRKVMTFTDTTGQQYVLFYSLITSEEYLVDFFEGAQIILEGALTQDTYAGLPVLRELGSRPAEGITNLDDYDIQAGEVYEQPAFEDEIADDMADGINIDTVELVYFAYDLRHGGGGLPLSESPTRFIQPVWRFSGALADGRLVDILVQAVTDDYLQ